MLRSSKSMPTGIHFVGFTTKLIMVWLPKQSIHTPLETCNSVNSSLFQPVPRLSGTRGRSGLCDVYHVPFIVYQSDREAGAIWPGAIRQLPRVWKR